VGRGLNPHLGFLAGWAMILDYLLQPLINTVWISTALHERYLPQIPYIAWAALIAGIMTVLNLAGVKSSARANKVLLAVMSVVIVFFVVLAVRYLWHGQGWAGLLSTEPFYNPKTFNSHKILTATSFAALTYIGFDGVTTLAEDVENPKRNVLLAAVLVCVFTGLFSGLQVYLAQLVWPDHTTLQNPETAFMDVARIVGGPLLFAAYVFHPETLWLSLKHARLLTASAAALGMRGAYLQMLKEVTASSPVLVFLLPITLGAYIVWRRCRYFGNTAPLLMAVLFLAMRAASPHAPDTVFSLIAVVFLFVFVAGIMADLLETQHRDLVAAVLAGLLVANALWNLWGLAKIIG
jgi:amino acid transporter